MAHSDKGNRSPSWGLLTSLVVALLVGCAGATSHAAATPTASTAKLSARCDSLDGMGATLTPTGSYGSSPPTDGDGVALTLPATPPQRIITLRPAASEIVAALGLGNRLIGIDHATDYPQAILGQPVVTDAADTPQVATIRTLKPDLVLSDGGATLATDAALRKVGLTVISLPAATTLPQTLSNILLAGQILGATTAANTLVARMESCIAAVQGAIGGQTGPAAYIELAYTPNGTATTAGKGSLEDALLSAAGGQNVFAATNGYSTVKATQVIAANPQVIILAEPITVAYVKPQDRPTWTSIAAIQGSHIFVVRDDLLGRAGPRSVQGLAALAEDLWPTLFS